VLVSVPAYPWLFSTWDQQLQHYRRYTRRGLQQVLEQSGFAVRRCTYAFSYALPPAIVRRLVGRDYTASHCVFPPLPRFLNALLLAAGCAEAAWLRALPLPFGLSLYALAEIT
jgi:hypothetical protein